MKCKSFALCKYLILCCMFFYSTFASAGAFDTERWESILTDIRTQAENKNIRKSVIDETLKSPFLIPGIIKSDKTQSEFTLTLEQYLNRTVTSERIKNGQAMRKKYPTLLNNVYKTYNIQPEVLLAFWGMESNYGKTKSKHQLTNAFLTLIYDGRREKFFKDQLLSLMKTADKNKLSINKIHGSWAGAMGHFQFIPTTLEQYGIDGNKDGRIDIINNIVDAMFSAGNYLNKLGWNPKEPIAERVILPTNFDINILDGNTKKTLKEWAILGVMYQDGSLIPESDTIVGIVADTKEISKSTPENKTIVTAYLTYPNFYRIKKWNNSSWYALAIAELSEKLK